MLPRGCWASAGAGECSAMGLLVNRQLLMVIDGGGDLSFLTAAVGTCEW